MKYFMMSLSMAISLVLVGCGASTEKADHDDHAQGDEHGHDEHAEGGEHGHGEHGHPEEGPHDGSLIELGNEEYHAELVHDDAAKTVTIYLLDSAAKMAVPIEATELLVNLTHDGSAEQFSLAASPLSTDPSGKSSRFVSTDAELAEDLDLEDVEAKLIVSIGGKQYRGAIEHDHDHEEHHDDDDHEHDH